MKAWQSYGSILALTVSVSLTSACEVSHRYDKAPATAGKGGGSAGAAGKSEAGNGGKGGGTAGKGSAGKDDADAGEN